MATNMSDPGWDQSFWASSPDWYRLTLKFQETIMGITPSSVMALLSPFLIVHYFSEPVRVRRNWLLWAKVVTGVALVGIEVANLAFRSSSSAFRTTTTLPAASVDVLAAISVTAVLYYEHIHAIRSSAVLGVYLFLATVADAIKCGTLFNRAGLAPSAGLSAAACAVRLALLALEELPKRDLLLDHALKELVGDESASGFWRRSFLLYLNPLFFAGYGSDISMANLDNLGPDLAAETVHPQLKRCLYSGANNGSAKVGLAVACFRAWKSEALVIVIPYLANSAFNFANPFILYRVIHLVESGNATGQQTAALAGAAMLCFVGAALTKAIALQLSCRLTTKVRVGIISLLFEKTLHLHQREATKSAAVTLMSADVDMIATAVPTIYMIFAAVLDTSLGTYLLSRFVGLSCFMSLIPLVLSTIVSYFIGGWIAFGLAGWNKSLQSRVAKTSQLLSQITAIKMHGLGPTVEGYLQHLRQLEVTASKIYRSIFSLSNIPSISADLMTPVVVIAGALFWKTFNGGFSAASVFPALAVVMLVKESLVRLLGSYPNISSMGTCFRRIEEYLALEEQADPRIVMDYPRSSLESVSISSWPLVEFDRVSIAPLGTETAILEDLTFSILPGTMTAVAGPNGSGKTSLLRSLLGETELICGLIQLHNTLMGFCDQTVWLRNVSIKENIINFLPYDPVLFGKVIKCVLLDQDLQRLVGGADYLVGSGGSKLSGGQRQRLAIARALYSSVPLLVLDDIFSALDRKTALSILLRLCGEDGLLKQLNCTVVIATNFSECIDLADQVIVLDGEGEAKVETPSELSQSRQEVLQRIATQATSTSTDQENDEQESIRPIEAQRDSASDASTGVQDRNHSKFNLYRFYIGQIGFFRLTLWAILMFLAAAGEIFPEIYMRLWLEYHAEDTSYFIGYAVLAGLTCFVFATAALIMEAELTPRAALSIHLQLAGTVLRATIGFLSGTDHGEILNKFSQDMTIVIRQLPASLMRTFYTFFLTAIITGVVVSGSVYMAATLPFLIGIVYFIQRFYLRTSRQLRTLDLEKKSPLYTHFEETAKGLMHIRGFGWKTSNLEHAFVLLDESQKAVYYLSCIHLWLGLVLGMLSAVMAGLLVVFALSLSHSSAGGAIGLSFFNLMSMASMTSQFILAWTRLDTTIAVLYRLQRLWENTPQEVADSQIELPEHWPSKGRIELENASATYGSQASDEEHQVLRDLTLSIPGGNKVAIIGRTGSGKSSLFMALLGFLKYNGVMKIDGIDISAIAPDELRARVVTISQDLLKLDASVRVNLLPCTLIEQPPKKSGNATARDGGGMELGELRKKKDEEIQELLARLGLWSHVEAKGGLDAMLDDVGYSHGELQLFGLARAILRSKETGTKLVLMDEATSSVESETEKLAQLVMTEYFVDSTVLIIGHSDSSIRGADTTVELSDGKIVRVSSAQQTGESSTTVTPAVSA